jgi:hypothetical protein
MSRPQVREQVIDHLLAAHPGDRPLYATRYHPACALYIAECYPGTRADVLIGNDDPACPILVRT